MGKRYQVLVCAGSWGAHPLLPSTVLKAGALLAMQVALATFQLAWLGGVGGCGLLEAPWTHALTLSFCLSEWTRPLLSGLWPASGPVWPHVFPCLLIYSGKLPGSDAVASAPRISQWTHAWPCRSARLSPVSACMLTHRHPDSAGPASPASTVCKSSAQGVSQHMGATAEPALTTPSALSGRPFAEPRPVPTGAHTHCPGSGT